MNPRYVALAVLVIGVVALAIYLAMRPSQAAGSLAGSGASSGGTSAGNSVQQIGSSGVSLLSSIVNAAGG